MIYNRPRPQVGLPRGYTKVDYIASSGTQYIDTGFVASSSMQVVIDFEVTEQPTSHKIIFGCRTSYSSSDQFVLGFAGHKSPAVWRSDFGSSQTSFDSSVLWSTRFKGAFGQNGTALNDASVTNPSANFVSDHNLYLFGNNDNGTTNGFISAKLYSCQILDSGRVVRKYIPCLNENMTPGLYDLISKTFFANAGTGSFEWGFDAVSSPVGKLPVGSIVKIMMDISEKEFIVIHQGLPDASIYDVSCKGTWLLLKDCIANQAFSSSNSNNYQASLVHTNINGSLFYNNFEPEIQALFKTVKIPYVDGNGKDGTLKVGVDGLETKCFLLSAPEAGWTTGTNSNIYLAGSKTDYFKVSAGDSKRIAYYNGSAVGWWHRTPYKGGTYPADTTTVLGEFSSTSVMGARGIRPAVILDLSTPIDGTNIKLG